MTTTMTNLGDSIYEVFLDGALLGTAYRVKRREWIAHPWVPGGSGGPLPEFACRRFATRGAARIWLGEEGPWG